jgi:hypothetical protein
MNRTLPIYVRAHTVPLKQGKRKGRYAGKKQLAKWPQHILVLDCETTTDVCQSLLFGFARLCELTESGNYECIEEIIFYADDVPERNPKGLNTLQQFVSNNSAETVNRCQTLKLVSRSEFIEQYFWPTVLATGMIVCFNAPFDLSRLAVDCREARKKNEGWSLIMSQDIDPKTGLKRESPFRPRVKITPRDSKSAFIKLTRPSIRSRKSGKRLHLYKPGRFLDVKTQVWTLRNKSVSLKAACELFGVENKLEYEPTGRVSLEEIIYCRQDVRATVALLNALRVEFNLHDIDLRPDRAYSPATIAKAYLRGMNIILPSNKFKISDEVQGIAMQAYFGGQTECRIRHLEMPIIHTDLMSEYTTTNTNMRLFELLTAASLRAEDATNDIRQMLDEFRPEMIFERDYWPRLRFFALVLPSENVLPIRTTYNGQNTNIGINPLTSEKRLWYAGPDIIAATLRDGKPPQIVRAVRVVAEGKQQGMKRLWLRGQIEIDSYIQDFFKSIIESRAIAKTEGKKDLADFLKVLASSGSYGLFVQVDPTQMPKGERESIDVFSGETRFPTTTETIEKEGPWYFPIFGSLITAAGRLMLALIAHLVAKRGGSYLFCDTDSMAIVATEKGGLIACPGGAFRLPDGREAVKTLSWKDVEEIRDEMDRLNPYDRNVVRESILKIESINFVNGVQRQLFGYAIASKRYVIYAKTGSQIEIVSAKAHGLGFLYPPQKGYDKNVEAPIWVIEAWEWILGEIGIAPKTIIPRWFDLPAMMRCSITTRNVLRALQQLQGKVPYPRRAGKPFNFVMLPLLDEFDGSPIAVDPDKLSLIAPFTSDSSRWYDLDFVNIHDENVGTDKVVKYRLAKADLRLPSQVLVKTYGDFVKRYRWHPEAKSNGPDSKPCDARTQGLLSRIPVFVQNIGYIGKETDRKWEHGEDISLLDSKVTEYRPNETEKLVTDTELQYKLRQCSIRAIAHAAQVSENTVKRARRGERLQKTTCVTLQKALKLVLSST